MPFFGCKHMTSLPGNCGQNTCSVGGKTLRNVVLWRSELCLMQLRSIVQYGASNFEKHRNRPTKNARYLWILRWCLLFLLAWFLQLHGLWACIICNMGLTMHWSVQPWHQGNRYYFLAFLFDHLWKLFSSATQHPLLAHQSFDSSTNFEVGSTFTKRRIIYPATKMWKAQWKMWSAYD